MINLLPPFSENIAYDKTTYQISTIQYSSNAVDEKSSTFSRTGNAKNPWIKVNFDQIQRVKYMLITLSTGKEIKMNN